MRVFHERAKFLFVLLGHANETDAVPEMRVPADNFGPGLDLFIVQPEHYINTGWWLERLDHLDIAAALADIRGLTAAREILHNVARLGRQGHFHARILALSSARARACARIHSLPYNVHCIFVSDRFRLG